MEAIITTDNQVRTYIPNVFATVTGEVSLYNKLAPYLSDAQLWMESIIPITVTMEPEPEPEPDEEPETPETPEDNEPEESTEEEVATLEDDVPVTPDPRTALIERAIVLEAFRRAVPSLDLVLTPNGFGIVSNDNMAPASSDRVNRLVEQLEAERDLCIEQIILLQMQKHPSVFHDYPQYRLWIDTIFHPFELQRMNGAKRLLASWLQDRYRIDHTENDLADKFVSQAVLQMIRGYHTTLSVELQYVRSELCNAIWQIMQGHECPVWQMRSLTDYCRKKFPDIWAESTTAVRYQDHHYENQRNSGGFWL